MTVKGNEKNKIEKEKLKQMLVDAIEAKAKALEEYKKTPTCEHLKKAVDELELDENSGVLLVTYNPTTEQMVFKGIKTKTSDLVAMAMYALNTLAQRDNAGIMDCVSTLARQEKLNDCWVEHNEKPTEIKDDDEQ